MSQSGTTHKLVATAQTVHTGYFDSTIPPVLTIESGDTVILTTMMLFDNQLRCGITSEELSALRRTYAERMMGPHTLSGPIFVHGAEPGDVLEVRIQKLLPIDYGINLNLPGNVGAGGLPEDFPDGQCRTLKFDSERKEAIFSQEITIPLKPFFGVMGVAPGQGERKPAGVPDYFGGNIDNKELVAGTTLYLPVQVKGALFSAGDVHAAQGDGEVNLTAIETALEEGILRFVVRKNMKLVRPMGETETHWITMGFHRDLNEAVKIALRDAIQFLVRTKGVTPNDAYALCSMAVDLRVTQIVDGNKGIHAMIPKSIFKK
jgi:acetamidase/formamidase